MMRWYRLFKLTRSFRYASAVRERERGEERDMEGGRKREGEREREIKTGREREAIILQVWLTNM